MTGGLATGAAARGRPLDDREFALVAALLAEHTGLLFPPAKRRDLDGKLAGYLEGLTAAERDGLVERLRGSDAELQAVVNRLTIGESHFFRNRPHFAALRADILPQLIAANAATRTLRIWSAGCATGEEPYSLAILLRDEFPQLRGWNVQILGTDLNTAFLERAREAVFGRWSFRGVEQRLMDAYFAPEGPAGLRLDPELARAVELRWFNLARFPYLGRIAPEPFDLVICRNVLIYFSFELANRAVRALAETVRKGGFLVVGHAESFPALRELESVYSHATYYYRRGLDAAPPRFEPALAHTVSIPGIGVHSVERRPSLPPPPPPASAPRPPARARPAMRPVRGVDDDNLLHELEEAQELTDAGQLDAAERLLDRLAAGAGRLSHRVHFLRAVVADQHDRTQDALASLRQAIFLEKEFALGHYYMGVIHEREGDAKAARRSLRNVVDLAARLPGDAVLEEGGGITARMLREIAGERIAELELE